MDGSAIAVIGTALLALHEPGKAREPQLPPQAAEAIALPSNARLVDYSTRVTRFQPSNVRIDTFIASVPVSSAATVGIGRFNTMSSRRNGVQDQPLLLEPRKPRRAAVGLSLRF